jgi:hypothetical protein
VGVSLLTEARATLYEAIAPVLPGRVAALPPTQAPYPPPYIWIDQTDGGLQSAGGRTQLTVPTFPVWISYDGAVKAQVAGLEDLIAKVWDACLHVPAARPTGWSPQTVDVAGQSVRGTVISVDVTVGAFTLCRPEVEASPIPPEPVLEEV